jgi:hypothetical protein
MEHSTSGSIFFYLTKEEYFKLAEEIEKENLSRYRNPKKRIESQYKNNQAKLNFIYALEEKWDEYLYYGEEDFTPLYNILQKRVERIAKNRAKYWKNKRISHHDFESAYWEEIWRIVKDYDGLGEFYLYETILLAINRRSHDVTRNATVKGNNRINHLAESLNEQIHFIPTVNIENEITTKILVEQIISDASLSDSERNLLKTIYEYPEAKTNQQLAALLGLPHRETIRRMLKRVQEKVLKYPASETFLANDSWVNLEWRNK